MRPTKGRLAMLLTAGLVAGAGGCLGGCTTVRNELGTRNNQCFSVLPTARGVVGQSPSFAGVRYLTPQNLVTSLDRATHHTVAIPAGLRAARSKPACIVGYTGTVSAGVSEAAWQPEAGPERFTVVLVRQSDHRVLGVVVLPEAPFRFTHLA